MNLTEIFHKDSIIFNLKATTKKEAMVELAQKLAEQDMGLTTNAVLDVLNEREKLGSTGIGLGVAIPHGKVAEIKKIVGGIARSKAGIDFESQDGEKVHFFFPILAPENAAGAHLKLLARLSRLLKEKSFRDSLMNAENVEKIYELFAQEEESL